MQLPHQSPKVAGAARVLILTLFPIGRSGATTGGNLRLTDSAGVGGSSSVSCVRAGLSEVDLISVAPLGELSVSHQTGESKLDHNGTMDTVGSRGITRLLSASEVAEILGVRKMRVYALLKRGTI